RQCHSASLEHLQARPELGFFSVFVVVEPAPSAASHAPEAVRHLLEDIDRLGGHAVRGRADGGCAALRRGSSRGVAVRVFVFVFVSAAVLEALCSAVAVAVLVGVLVSVLVSVAIVVLAAVLVALAVAIVVLMG